MTQRGAASLRQNGGPKEPFVRLSGAVPGLCKLSIKPTSCVSQTESRFIHWDMVSLLVAKFIPGFSAVAPPIAAVSAVLAARHLLDHGYVSVRPLQGDYEAWLEASRTRVR